MTLNPTFYLLNLLYFTVVSAKFIKIILLNLTLSLFFGIFYLTEIVPEYFSISNDGILSMYFAMPIERSIYGGNTR